MLFSINQLQCFIDSYNQFWWYNI